MVNPFPQLAAAHKLIPSGDKPTHVIKVDQSSFRVLKFHRGVLEENEEPNYDAQPESGEVRIEEDGALLN
jgi:hypothetical protein